MRKSPFERYNIAFFATALLLLGCGGGSSLKTKKVAQAQIENVAVPTVSPTPIQVVVPNCASFAVTSQANNLSPKLGESVRISVGITSACTGAVKYQIQGSGFNASNSAFTQGIEFAKTFLTVGTSIEKYSVLASDATSGAVLSSREIVLTFNVLAMDVPLPVAPSVTITRNWDYKITGLNQPIKVKLNINGNFVSATLNNTAVAANSDVLLYPLSATSNVYTAKADVHYGGSVPVHVEQSFFIPSCTHSVDQVTSTSLKTTTRLLNDVIKLVVDGNLILPLIISNAEVKTTQILNYAPGTRPTVARVYNANEDSTQCSDSFKQLHNAVATAVGSNSPMNNATGYSTSGARGLLMGGGFIAGDTYSITSGSSDTDIITSFVTERNNSCNSNEVIVGISGMTNPAYWQKIKCAQLVAGLETYSPRTVNVLWTENVNGSCSANEVLTGTRFVWCTPGSTDCGKYGRLELECSKLRWQGE